MCPRSSANSTSRWRPTRRPTTISTFHRSSSSSTWVAPPRSRLRGSGRSRRSYATATRAFCTRLRTPRHSPMRAIGSSRTVRSRAAPGWPPPPPAAPACELAGELGVPFTFTAHGHDIYRRPPADFARRAARAAAVVTVSQVNARTIVERFDVPAEHVRVIACGVDTSRFRPNGAPASPRRIVCVARLVPVKNLGLLLEACSVLRSRGVEFRAVLVGDGRCRGELEAARERLGLAQTFELVGAATQRRVVSLWQGAAVAALTSDSEGMPVSLMEAGACGLPAVATAVGGVPELVDHGITGFLVPAGNAPALAAALEQLLHDQDLAARLGAAARVKVQRSFSIAGQVDRLLSLWSEVLA